MPAAGSATFDAQVERVVRAGYAEALGTSERELCQRLEPLRAVLLSRLERQPSGSSCVLVVIASPEAVLPRVEPSKGRAFVDLRPKRAADFRPIDGLRVPDAEAYVLSDVDCGGDLLDVTPEAALRVIRSRHRSPLTIEEGVAVLVQHPDVLEERNAFSLLGSRSGDRRVPALWTSRVRDRIGPRLGWCWDGNAHTWLGSASCGGRDVVP